MTDTDKLMETVRGHANPRSKAACPDPKLPAYDQRSAERLAAIGLSGRTEAVECEAGHWHVTEGAE